jgi:hypothetical protein
MSNGAIVCRLNMCFNSTNICPCNLLHLTQYVSVRFSRRLRSSGLSYSIVLYQYIYTERAASVPEDGGNMFLSNAGIRLQDCTVLQHAYSATLYQLVWLYSN